MALKPHFLTRKSGLFVRFFVPSDLQRQVGSRYIVRSLAQFQGHQAHVVGWSMAVSLSRACDAMRQGISVSDLDKLLNSAQQAIDSGKTKEWGAELVTVNGVEFRNVKTKGKADTQDFVDTVKQLAGVGGPPPPPPEPMLSALIDDHLLDLVRLKRSQDTLTESRHTLRIFLGVVGDMPIDKVKRDHVRAFWDGVKCWPSNATKKAAYKDMSVLEIIARGKAEKEIIARGKTGKVPEPSAYTQAKHRQRLAVFFNDLVAADILKKTPIAGNVLKVDTSDEATGRPFTDDELKLIFGEGYLKWAAKYSHRRWGPILGLYSGARVTEVAQLYVADIEEREGVWGFHINDRYEGQKIKNISSRRFIPLAQPVLDSGFLAFYNEAKDAKQLRLFPALPNSTGLGYGRQLSRQFGSYLQKLGIEQGVAFHAFRHTMATRLNRAQKTELQTARITGHKVKGSVLAINYIDEQTLPERVETLAAFIVPVTLPVYASPAAKKKIT